MFNKSNLCEIVENNSEMFHFNTPVKEIINTENLDIGHAKMCLLCIIMYFI